MATLSKEQIYSIKSFMAFILRHKPHFYKIRLDDDAYTSVKSVLDAVIKNKKIDITKDQIIDIAKHHSGGIFIIVDDKIRAKDGHTATYNMKIPNGFSEVSDVPNTLFFLIEKNYVSKIISDGGISLSNRKMLLSPKSTIPPADQSQVTLNSQKAKLEMIKFYSNGSDFFVHYLPSKFLSIHV